MSASITCYVSQRKAKTGTLCKAFAAGARRVGAQAWCTVSIETLAAGPALFYGVQPDTKAIFEAARRRGDWIYLDNGYFGRGAYYRATRDRLQHDGRGAGDATRLAAFDFEIQPWRRGGRHILICPQSDYFMDMVCGLDGTTWRANVVRVLRPWTDRPIVIREKNSDRPLAADLAECHALVTHMSNVAVEAVQAGVPAFLTGPGAALAMGSANLSKIETPVYPEGRRAWAECLAANQWTLAELAAGDAWRALSRSEADGPACAVS